MTHPEQRLPAGHLPSMVVAFPIQYIAEEGITSGWRRNPWIICVDPVRAPVSFKLSTPWLGSQFGVKNRLPLKTAGVGVVSAKSMA